jgi:chitinase
MDHKTSLVKHLDPWLELGDNGGFGFLEKVLSLKKSNPDLKISAGLGGFSEGSVKYSLMANDEVKRNIFVESVVQFLTKFQLDGLDFNWVFPGKNIIQTFRFFMEPDGYLLFKIKSP